MIIDNSLRFFVPAGKRYVGIDERHGFYLTKIAGIRYSDNTEDIRVISHYDELPLLQPGDTVLVVEKNTSIPVRVGILTRKSGSEFVIDKTYRYPTSAFNVHKVETKPPIVNKTAAEVFKDGILLKSKKYDVYIKKSTNLKKFASEILNVFPQVSFKTSFYKLASEGEILIEGNNAVIKDKEGGAVVGHVPAEKEPGVQAQVVKNEESPTGVKKKFVKVKRKEVYLIPHPTEPGKHVLKIKVGKREEEHVVDGKNALFFKVARIFNLPREQAVKVTEDLLKGHKLAVDHKLSAEYEVNIRKMASGRWEIETPFEEVALANFDGYAYIDPAEALATVKRIEASAYPLSTTIIPKQTLKNYTAIVRKWAGDHEEIVMTTPKGVEKWTPSDSDFYYINNNSFVIGTHGAVNAVIKNWNENNFRKEGSLNEAATFVKDKATISRFENYLAIEIGKDTELVKYSHENAEKVAQKLSEMGYTVSAEMIKKAYEEQTPITVFAIESADKQYDIANVTLTTHVAKSANEIVRKEATASFDVDFFKALGWHNYKPVQKKANIFVPEKFANATFVQKIDDTEKQFIIKFYPDGEVQVKTAASVSDTPTVTAYAIDKLGRLIYKESGQLKFNSYRQHKVASVIDEPITTDKRDIAFVYAPWKVKLDEKPFIFTIEKTNRGLLIKSAHNNSEALITYSAIKNDGWAQLITDWLSLNKKATFEFKREALTPMGVAGTLTPLNKLASAVLDNKLPSYNVTVPSWLADVVKPLSPFEVAAMPKLKIAGLEQFQKVITNPTYFTPPSLEDSIKRKTASQLHTKPLTITTGTTSTLIALDYRKNAYEDVVNDEVVTSISAHYNKYTASAYPSADKYTLSIALMPLKEVAWGHAITPDSMQMEKNMLKISSEDKDIFIYSPDIDAPSTRPITAEFTPVTSDNFVKIAEEEIEPDFVLTYNPEKREAFLLKTAGEKFEYIKLGYNYFFDPLRKVADDIQPIETQDPYSLQALTKVLDQLEAVDPYAYLFLKFITDELVKNLSGNIELLIVARNVLAGLLLALVTMKNQPIDIDIVERALEELSKLTLQFEKV